MATQINTLIKQAIRTFGGVKDKFPHNLELLRGILDRISGSDVGFANGHSLLLPDTWRQPGKAPVTYVDIYEDHLVSVGMFVLKEGMKLPLHDHPHMHGLIKVIAGSVLIRSYSITQINDDSTIEADEHEPVTVKTGDGSCVLEPNRQNLHEIESVGGTAAFLDVLSPPYDALIPEYGPRKCSYFKLLRRTGVGKFVLGVTDSPPWFWTDTHPYSGPEILEEQPLVDRQESESH